MYTFEVSHKLEGNKCRVVITLAEQLPMWLFDACQDDLRSVDENFRTGTSVDWTNNAVALIWRATFSDWRSAADAVEFCLTSVVGKLSDELARQKELEKATPVDFSRRYELQSQNRLVLVD